MPTTVGSNSTVPVLIARLTVALVTPGTRDSVFSMTIAHDEHVMPISPSVTLPDDSFALAGVPSSSAV